MAKVKLPISRAKTAYGLLSEVCALITEEPLRYNQGDWIALAGDDSAINLPAEKYPSCGTVGCVAGWVATLKHPEATRRWWSVEPIAMRALGLDSEKAFELFNSEAVKGRGQTAAHARSGVKHIRKFQKKYRHQLLAKKV
jgi:hypothetical protein